MKRYICKTGKCIVEDPYILCEFYNNHDMLVYLKAKLCDE
jgi:hypothetical protein